MRECRDVFCTEVIVTSLVAADQLLAVRRGNVSSGVPNAKASSISCVTQTMVLQTETQPALSELPHLLQNREARAMDVPQLGQMVSVGC